MDEHKLLERITVNPQVFGGKPIIRGRRLAVEHVLAMLAAGDERRRNTKGLSMAGEGRHPGVPRLCTPGYSQRTN